MEKSGTLVAPWNPEGKLPASDSSRGSCTDHLLTDLARRHVDAARAAERDAEAAEAASAAMEARREELERRLLSEAGVRDEYVRALASRAAAMEAAAARGEAAVEALREEAAKGKKQMLLEEEAKKAVADLERAVQAANDRVVSVLSSVGTMCQNFISCSAPYPRPRGRWRWRI